MWRAQGTSWPVEGSRWTRPWRALAGSPRGAGASPTQKSAPSPRVSGPGWRMAPPPPGSTALLWGTELFPAAWSLVSAALHSPAMAPEAWTGHCVRVTLGPAFLSGPRPPLWRTALGTQGQAGGALKATPPTALPSLCKKRCFKSHIKTPLSVGPGHQPWRGQPQTAGWGHRVDALRPRHDQLPR